MTPPKRRAVNAPKTVSPKKAEPKPTRRPYQNPADRVCVKMGLARVVGPRVEYDWPMIDELWLVDPDNTILGFCKKYDITYAQAHKRLTMSVTRKKAIQAVSRNGYMLAVVRGLLASHHRAAHEDAERFSKTISELTVFSHSAAAFARARMMKMGPGGEEMVNVDAKSSDVAYYARIARDASETLRNLLELKVNVDGTEEQRQEIEGITIDEPKRPNAGTSGHDEEAQHGQPEAPAQPTGPDAQAIVVRPDPGVRPD